MSELDDLPSWAGRSTEEVRLPTGPPEETPVTGDTEPEQQASPVEAQPEIAASTAAAQAPRAQSTASVGEPARTAPEPEQAAPPAEPKSAPPKRSRWRRLFLGLFGLAILAGAAAIGYSLASQDSDSTEATGSTPTDDSDDGATPASAADPEDSDTDAASGDADGDAVATDADEPATDDAAETEDGSETVTLQVDDEDPADGEAGTAGESNDGEAPLNDGDRQAIFRGGKVYLSGAVPSDEVGAAIVAKAEAVVGPGNVINDYVIDPSTTIVPGSSAPLYVEDVVLFEFNSIEIATPFLPILDLGTLLLRQNPQASVTVVTRTDAVGSEEINLEVAGRRAQAVINYWLSQGVDADQIIADPRGEEGTSDDDDAETAARQRRAEFIITGLLD